MKLKTLLFIFSFANIVWSQNLTISSSGQTGTSGTNWSISGTNPVIITATGTANVNTSVIMGYLNTGTSVILESLTSNGSVYLASSSAIVKNAGGDATLTFKAANQAIVSSSISSSSSKLNIVLWSDYNNNNIAGVAIASVINTNGGHLWAGGSSSAAGSYTWNGLTVGNGPSVGSSSSNNYGMDFFSSSIATGGGDILLWAGAGSISAYDGIGLQNNPHLNAGSGNVTLITRQIFNAGNTVSITSTGKLTLTTDSNNPWTSAFNWSTTTAGSNVTLTSALGQPLQINNFSSLGGLSLGVYDGFGSSFSFTNNQNININSSINIPGPINVYGGLISLGVGVEVFASTANGSMNFQGKSGFSTVANSGSTRGKLMTTGGGNITISADSDNNNSGTLDIDWLTIDGNTGHVLLETAIFSWNAGSQVSLPEFYSSGGALTIRNTTSSNYDISTNWFAMFGTFGGVTLGREGGTGAIALVSCTSCHSSALNFGTTAFQIAGPITVLGAIINANINLHSTNIGSDILLKATKNVIVGENVSIRTNNGDITFWSNSNGVADATDGDFIGIQNAVVINSADGSTTQTTGGGTITMAGGTTTQTLASGTIVPTGYAYSNRTTNWGPLLPPGGVNFGFSTAANGQVNSLSIYSGGGNIVIKGKSHSSSAGIQWFSGSAGATQIINSGVGTILFDGLATSTNAHGIEFMSYASVVSPTIISSNTSSDAIRIIGETFSTNLRSGYQGTVKLEASGIGGGIEVNGKVGSSSNYAAIEAGTLNAYALSGPITFISEGGLGLKAGGTWGKGTLASSSSNITLRSDKISLYTATIETTGTLTVEPLGTSFASALTFPITNLTVGNTVSGLTLGKSTNTANITFANATTIAGPITAYGGNIFAQQNLTSTLNGAAILLQATGYIDVSASDIIQTSNGNITLRANASGTANTTTSAITLNSGSSLLSNGGNITLGGNFSGTQGAGLYAASARVNGSPGILINNATLTAAGGNINIYGRSSTSYDDGIRLQANINTTGAGSIGIYGDAFGGYNGTQYFGGISFFNEVSRIEAVSGNVTLEGILTNSQSSEGYAINFYRSSGLTGQIKHIQILSQTGDIQITADRGSSIGGGIGHSSWGHIYFGSPSNNSYTASGDIKFTYSNIVNAANNGFKVKTTGAVTYEPAANSFIAAQTLPVNSNYVLAESASRLTIGKTTNIANISIASAQTIAGPIEISGGDILINENLNTGAGASAGSVLLKGSGDVILAATKSITTSGAPVILWANSDNGTTNGSIALRNGSSIVTGSASVAGGAIWLGGGSDGATWNGLSVGNGYAVPGTSFTPSNGGGTLNSGVYLERNSISSFGGNIKIAGDAATGFAAIATYGNTITINAGSGKIEMDGQVTNTAAGNRMGVLFGLHDNTVISTVNILSSSTSGDAITITGVGRGTEDAIGLSGTLNITSSGGGNIVMNGNALGTGRSIVAGNYYHGIMNVFANSRNITLNGNTKAVQVATPVIGGLTSGPSKINIGQGGSIASSSSDVFVTADNIALAANGIGIISTGKVTIEPSSSSFASAITYPITNLSVANTVSGLTLGKSTNTANVTFGATTNIAGPITAFGGTIAINENISSSNGSKISLFGNALTFGTGKTVTSNNGQLIIAPQSVSNSIGLGGATGTLQLPASYFSTNFADGFSNIQIGSNTQSGNIAANTFTLRDHMTLLTSGSLTLGGKPVLGNNNITLGASISSISASASNYFQTNGTGKVISTLANNASRLFPVGNAAYNPISINNKTEITDTFSVNLMDTAYLNGSSSGLIENPYVKRTWNISKNIASANAGSGVDLTFNWNANEVVGTLTNPTLNHHNGSGWEIPTMGTSSVSGNSLTYTGYKGTFSPFAIGGSSTFALPVELKSFNAVCSSDHVQIEWTTASEKNNDRFELYKSLDAKTWTKIHTVKGQGTKATETNYRFFDFERQSNYYRLNDIDFNGKILESNIIVSNCKDEIESTSIFPNPATDYIMISTPWKENTILRIITLSGVLLREEQLIFSKSYITVKDLKSGVYLIEIDKKGSIERLKLIKQ